MAFTSGFYGPPSPQKFGVSLIRLDSVIVRIYRERGASMEKRDSKVSALGLPPQRQANKKTDFESITNPKSALLFPLIRPACCAGLLATTWRS